MPITRSAKRAVRVSTRKKGVNDRNKKIVKESIKMVEKNATAKDAKKMVSAAYSAIDKAAKRGVITKNTAARRKARLSRITKTK